MYNNYYLRPSRGSGFFLVLPQMTLFGTFPIFKKSWDASCPLSDFYGWTCSMIAIIMTWWFLLFLCKSVSHYFQLCVYVPYLVLTPKKLCPIIFEFSRMPCFVLMFFLPYMRNSRVLRLNAWKLAWNKACQIASITWCKEDSNMAPHVQGASQVDDFPPHART